MLYQRELRPRKKVERLSPIHRIQGNPSLQGEVLGPHAPLHGGGTASAESQATTKGIEPSSSGRQPLRFTRFVRSHVIPPGARPDAIPAA